MFKRTEERVKVLAKRQVDAAIRIHHGWPPSDHNKVQLQLDGLQRQISRLEQQQSNDVATIYRNGADRRRDPNRANRNQEEKTDG